MSVHDWHVVGDAEYVGLANFKRLMTDRRFLESMGVTFYFTVLAVVVPVVLGVAAAVVFHREFPLRGVLRAIFIMPMMATPVAIALVWTMMFHPQLGVLNYLLSLVGLPPSLWVYSPNTVIPALVMVEVWHWTPLVMLIVLGGLAAIPTEPYESALIDGASQWQMFRHITFPLVLPFIMVAVVIRTIDALKTFDTIYVITQGGPGSASETINIYLYLQAFAYYQVGHASAVVVVFFVIIVILSLLLLYVRQKTMWSLKT
jgi:multiple sugar transport system permease protein